ncbi:hypothetical protein DY000_02064193 [Brassica cretica]|uniref:Uncharacterized protein n=1 Tax=Brassica cretica TaxID=69181 RepID=A0ABQ7AU20_BRACR|nr:hypothetical protein DY000_02064193 [Brassica cretica]
MNTDQDEEPFPSTGTRKGRDGAPPTAKTNHGRNQSSQGFKPKSQYWWIYELEKERRRLQSILPLQLSYM